MGYLREWWRENKAKNKIVDEHLRPNFEMMKLDGESFSEYKRRILKEMKQKK